MWRAGVIRTVALDRPQERVGEEGNDHEHSDAVGGVGGSGKNTAANEEYDPASDRWTERAPLPTPRDHHAAGAVNGKLYAIAGRIDGNHDRSVANNEEYDPKTDHWRTVAPIPTVRSGVGAAVLYGRVFVFGGEYNRATRGDVESFDPVTNKWQRWAPMPTARHGLGVAGLRQSIYVIAGGPKPGASFSSVNEVFTP